jgi:hypothetical protein
MRGNGIELEVEICATNITNKTKCMSTNAKKWGNICGDMGKHLWRHVVSTISAISGVKPEHSRLKPY